MANVEGSGRKSMSSSSPRTKPSIEPPSNVTRPSSACSSSSTGIETFLLTPKMSAKTKRTNRTLRSCASFTTSRFPAGRLCGVECINCNRQSKSELIVRAFQRASADFADLAQAVEHRVPVDVELRGGGLDVLTDRKVKRERSLELGLMLVVVGTQRREHEPREFAQPLDVRPFVQERIRAEIGIGDHATGTADAPSDRQRGFGRFDACVNGKQRFDGSDASRNAQRILALGKALGQKGGGRARVARIDFADCRNEHQQRGAA